MLFAIKETYPDGDESYLHHQHVKSLRFGEKETAWTTDNKFEALFILDRIELKNAGTDSIYEIVEL